METNFNQAEILDNTVNGITLPRSHKEGRVLIDVRSQKEFSEGTIPGAINIALFDNYERSVIGTIYRHGSKEAAVEKGFEFVQNRFPELMSSFEPFKDKKLTIYCAKGGMRSKSIVNLLVQQGLSAMQLTGGYRQYRQDTINNLDAFDNRLIVLHGMTGTGKTRLIEKLPNSIDLEDLAQHRSSLFGGIYSPPRNQKQFESLLTETLHSLGEAPHFVEGESNKIGAVFLPKSMVTAMSQGIKVWVTASLDTRIKRIIEDYPINNDEVREKMIHSIKILKKRLGNKTVAKLLSFLKDGDIYPLVNILLKDYYDIRYANMYTRYQFDYEISSEDIDLAVNQLQIFRKTQIQ